MKEIHEIAERTSMAMVGPDDQVNRIVASTNAVTRRREALSNRQAPTQSSLCRIAFSFLCSSSGAACDANDAGIAVAKRAIANAPVGRLILSFY